MQTFNDVLVKNKGVRTYDFYKVTNIINEKKNYVRIKRYIDIVVSLCLIVLLAPFFLLVALIVKIDSPGPVFFFQKRPGYKGIEFWMIKFRTMKQGAEESLYKTKKELISELGYHPKPKNDERITKIGKFLRKTSIDELPQLFNVLLGDMSLIGPRPVLEYMVKPYMNIQMLREQVRPGITGLWQVKDRHNGHVLTKMIEYDLDYIKNMSLKEDIRILLLTIPAVLSGKGAQ